MTKTIHPMGRIDWSDFNLDQLPSDVIKSRFTGNRLLKALLGAAAGVMMPRGLRQETNQIAEGFGITFKQAAALQLDYELGGSCCTTAAIPNPKTETYRMVRATDWDIPEEFSEGIRWVQLDHEVWMRAVPGYVGCVCGHSIDRGFGLALNQSEHVHETVDYTGRPLPWMLRSILRASDYENAVDRTRGLKPIVGGYVIIVGEHKAAWLEVDPSGNKVHQEVEYPDVLVVGNSDDDGSVSDERTTLDHWANKGTFEPEEIGQPVRNAMTADLVEFLV
jgi:hypothetical protein